MKQTEHEDFFDRWAKEYDTSVMDGKFPFSGYEIILNEVLDLAEVSPSMRVLDLGVGTGNLAGRFIQKGCQVWGLDLSTHMLEKTHSKWPQVNLVQADLLDTWSATLQPPFERIVSAYVFHEFNLADKISLLKRASTQYLAPGGFILIADAAFPTAAARAEAYALLQIAREDDEYYWAADEAITACESAGLHVTYQQVSSCGGIFKIMPK
jgi:predicted TPR repeat methyltransferase